MRHPLRSLVILLAVLASLAWAGVWLSTPVTKDAATFVVAAGEKTDVIVAHLKEKGVIRSMTLFKLALSKSGLATKLQPGTYDLRDAPDFEAVIRKLASGGIAANEQVLLVKEGWNLGDVKDALTKIGFAGGDLYRVTGVPAVDARTYNSDRAPWAKDFSADFPFLKDKPSYVSLEGFLFPDTYRLFKDATAEDVTRKMLENFDRKLTPELRSRIALGKHTVYEVVTMASIIEREVQTDEDRRKVADLFWRRLEKGMPLQADSTVNYATGKGLASVTFDDTKNVSPYNTYKYRGLPLGPICNPGLSAIAAAADPKANDAWYFLTDKDGKVYYARTLDEHNRNKARYLR
jgi:UPF0755 protein